MAKTQSEGNGNCDKCGETIQGYNDPHLRIYTVNGKELCDKYMLERIPISDL